MLKLLTSKRAVPTLVAASVLGLAISPAWAAPPGAPSEPEQTIDAIGADVSARTQWFGDAIDHLFTDTATPPEAAAPSAHRTHRQER